MKSILVIGMGRFGRHCARTISNLGHDVMAVDWKEKNIDAIKDVVTSCQIGDATDSQFMQTLGISDFDVAIICIGDDFQSSLEATSLCKEMGCPLVVARANRDIHAKFLSRNGADHVVYPEKQAAEWTAVTYSSEHIFDYIQLDDKNSIFELDIPPRWIGKSIIQLEIRKKYGINIMGIKENGVLNVNLDPNEPFRQGQLVLVIGQEEQVQKYLQSQFR